MHLFALLYLIISLAWLFIFSSKSLSLKRNTILKAFFAGLVFAPIAGAITHLLDLTFLFEKKVGAGISEFFLQFFLVGPVEEFSKFFACFIAAHKKQDFSNSYDGILLAISAAIGFAGVENVLYLYAFGLELTLPRLVLGNLGHATYSMFWGYSLGVVMHEGAPFSTLRVGLLLASLLHGAYNYFLNFSLVGAFISLLISLGLIFFLIQFLRSEKKRVGK